MKRPGLRKSMHRRKQLHWNGKEAVEKYEGTPKGCYSAILMDIMMPVMNGIEAARNIRCKEKNGGK